MRRQRQGTAAAVAWLSFFTASAWLSGCRAGDAGRAVTPPTLPLYFTPIDGSSAYREFEDGFVLEVHAVEWPGDRPRSGPGEALGLDDDPDLRSEQLVRLRFLPRTHNLSVLRLPVASAYGVRVVNPYTQQAHAFVLTREAWSDPERPAVLVGFIFKPVDREAELEWRAYQEKAHGPLTDEELDELIRNPRMGPAEGTFSLRTRAVRLDYAVF